MSTGVLLINLGTPDAPRTREVRRFLREFLSDPGVIDLPTVPRWLLVNLLILPTRPKRSARAYAEIWTPEGSPLMVHSLELVERLRARLDGTPIALAMRYGKPSIATGLAELRAAGCRRAIVVPLFPQYSDSTTGSILDRLELDSAGAWEPDDLAIVAPFYDHDGFLDAFAAVGRPAVDEGAADHVLFSFHGLPEKYIQKADESGSHCLVRDDCCDEIGAVNRSCYRAQCMATARGIAERLELEPERWSVSFQSRLGRTPWLGPYTDAEVVRLAESGVRSLAVYCPSFVADCLETLEEIGLRAAEDFRAAGGEALTMVPSLNATEPWVDALVDLVESRRASLPAAQLAESG